MFAFCMNELHRYRRLWCQAYENRYETLSKLVSGIHASQVPWSALRAANTTCGCVNHCPGVGQGDRGTLWSCVFSWSQYLLESETSPRICSVPLSGQAVQCQGWHYSFGMGGFSLGFVMGRCAGTDHPSFGCDRIHVPGPRVFWRKGQGEMIDGWWELQSCSHCGVGKVATECQWSILGDLRRSAHFDLSTSVYIFSRPFAFCECLRQLILV